MNAAMPWLDARRAESLESFRVKGLPHRRNEEWKYSDVRTAIGANDVAEIGTARWQIEGATGNVEIADLSGEYDEDAVDRENLLRVFRSFLDANQLEADWESVERAGNRVLVNSLSMMSPFGPAEKQALLEAPDLKTRAETLIAITEIVLAQGSGEGGNVLQ